MKQFGRFFRDYYQHDWRGLYNVTLPIFFKSKKIILDMESLIDKYNNEAERFAKLWRVDNQHIIEIIASVMMTRDGVGYPGGGFVNAVVANNLRLAVSLADSECLENIKPIVSSMNHHIAK
jgi:hypothetical protein